MTIAESAVIDADLLEPISSEEPSGKSLRYEPEWDEIKEARRADRLENVGEWEREGGYKAADWPLVSKLCSTTLREKTKDLQIAIWLTEALIHVQGFPGITEGLRLIRGLLEEFWDTLHPEIQDGDLEWRSRPLEWLNDKMADLIRETPITARSDGGDDYSLYLYRDSRQVGSKEDLKNAQGKVDREKEKAYNLAVSEGHISVEMFDEAVRASKRSDYEALYDDVQEAKEELKALSKVLDEKFGQADAPPLSQSREALEECSNVLTRLVKIKRQQEPDATPLDESAEGEESAETPGLWKPSWTTGNLVSSGSWQKAEELVRSGKVEEGLAEMVRLAASETSGRARFQRKLFLAEICLSQQRDRLARAILEELAEQIEAYKLTEWETSEMVGHVWSRLYQCYKTGDSGNEQKAAALYEKLCRLDPWQAFSCGD